MTTDAQRGLSPVRQCLGNGAIVMRSSIGEPGLMVGPGVRLTGPGFALAGAGGECGAGCERGAGFACGRAFAFGADFGCAGARLSARAVEAGDVTGMVP